ncbi:hypothetical protein D0C36_19325 [Mucilaginibacter conchicola]|uniref:Peptidase domain-containing ABC transporter n=1 Tax=Mucilaginibacter conchicola TaxID=2303333 RepID=A0A372NRW9_9SPHI|nr:cysteine peptidase family C39 domain-containing protein [Mucilaginibacter conchicola]RFZ91095.1 hypothetical protein D0C36_19325 [Mucilaginibacter conchicola]
MTSLNQYLKYFVHQYSLYDCGIAALAIVLNYAGKPEIADQLLTGNTAGADGVSLLKLRQLSDASGLKSRCVQMDISFLSNLDKPCILLVRKDAHLSHFIVCFGSVKRSKKNWFKIADPATGIILISQDELSQIWHDNAALYFEDLDKTPSKLRHPWFNLLKINGFKSVLLLIFPFMNICSTLLGLSVSWILQQGLNGSFTAHSSLFLSEILTMLFLIILFRNAVIYIRQYILIYVNSSVSKKLHINYLNNRKRPVSEIAGDSVTGIRKTLSDFQKIQQALSAFISVVVSDGVLVSFIIAGLLYYDSITGIINVIYLAVLIFTAFMKAPHAAAKNAVLSELSGSCEKGFIDENIQQVNENEQDKTISDSILKYREFHTCSKKTAVEMSKASFWYDAAGSLNIIIVFVYSLWELSDNHISYTGLMAAVIITLFVTSLVPRIINSFTLITEGALLARRYRDL